MSGWVILAIIAVVVWGIAQHNRRRGSQNNEDALRAHEEAQARLEAERERDELRERVQVLERIVTDQNTPAAQKTKKLADEIESLRREENGKGSKTTGDWSEG